GGDPAGQRTIGGLEPTDVVALPAVHGDRDLVEPGQRALGVDAQRGVAVAGTGVRVFDRGSSLHGDPSEAFRGAFQAGWVARSARNAWNRCSASAGTGAPGV